MSRTNANIRPRGAELVSQGLSPIYVAQLFGVSVQTVDQWVNLYSVNPSPAPQVALLIQPQNLQADLFNALQEAREENLLLRRKIEGMRQAFQALA